MECSRAKWISSVDVGMNSSRRTRTFVCLSAERNRGPGAVRRLPRPNMRLASKWGKMVGCGFTCRWLESSVFAEGGGGEVPQHRVYRQPRAAGMQQANGPSPMLRGHVHTTAVGQGRLLVPHNIVGPANRLVAIGMS